MIQIGDYHLGKAETAKEPTLDIIEASVVWDLLVSRYGCIEETQMYHNHAHDPDFKKMIASIGISMLEKQVNELEKQFKIYNMPLPKRPPKSYHYPEDSQILSDEFIFSKIFQGCQLYIDKLAYSIRSTVTNDPLRSVLTGFLKNDDLPSFEKLCRYGKQKGWLQPVPVYKTH